MGPSLTKEVDQAAECYVPRLSSTENTNNGKSNKNLLAFHFILVGLSVKIKKRGPNDGRSLDS